MSKCFNTSKNVLDFKLKYDELKRNMTLHLESYYESKIQTLKKNIFKHDFI